MISCFEKLNKIRHAPLGSQCPCGSPVIHFEYYFSTFAKKKDLPGKFKTKYSSRKRGLFGI